MRVNFFFALALSAMIVACDEKPKPPPITNADSSPKGPTTQELLTGPRTRMTLGALPLSLSVPAKTWKITTTEGGATLLRGRTPSGEASIELSMRPTTKADQLDLIFKGARKELAEKKDAHTRIEIKTLGENVKVLERFVVKPPASLAVIDEKGQEHIKTAQSVTWSFQIFVPHQSAYETYELKFISLTFDEYQTDKALLTEIMDSLMFEGPAAS